MTTINDAFTNALLADASYVGGLTSASILSRDLALRMTPSLAAYIGKNFSVVTQIESAGSSFDATVWRANNADGTPNLTGKIYVSMRGTQQATDFLVDADLAVTGNARSQIVDMVNWWFKISTPVGQSARQITLEPIYDNSTPPIELGTHYVAAPDVAGSGLLSAADLTQGIEVNGHSLGGYLATAFTRLFGSQAHVQHTSTFNSAGFAPGSEAVFTNLQNLIGPSYGLGRYPSTSEQSNYFASNGLNFTTNSFYFNQQGKRVEVFNEADATQVGNHYMYKLTDALALGNALSTLDATFTTAKLNLLLAAGSNKTEASLEGVLDALRRNLQGSGIAATQIGDADKSAPSRIDYYKNLDDLQQLPVFQSLTSKLIIKPTTGSDLIASARNNFGALVALQDLSAFAVSAINPAADTLLTGVWQSTRATDYAAWTADRSSATPVSFTDSWITDRAAMLASVVYRNQNDTTGVLTPNPAQGMKAGHYLDVASNTEITVGLDVSTTREYAFGGNAADTLFGRSAEDHLYGGAGDDTLDGRGGKDYLEGGTGTDTYQFTGAFGKDTILDCDGSGTLKLDGQTLSGGQAYGEEANKFKGKDAGGGEEIYQVRDDPRSSTGKTLIVTRGGDTANSITINNFDAAAAYGSQGYLGVKLDKTPAVAVIATKDSAASANGGSFWSDTSANISTLAGKFSELEEGKGQTFIINLKAAAKAGETLVLSLLGLASQGMKAVVGDRTVDAAGATITLNEGQTEVGFTLIQTGELTTDASGALSVTYTGSDGNATSNAWGVNLTDSGPTSQTSNGDQRAKLIGIETQLTVTADQPSYSTYAWEETSWAADGTLVNGVAELDFSDVITGTAANDKIAGLGGNDALDGGAGNDEIDGGSGDDLIGGGAGSDNIKGGDGNDFINSSASLNVYQRLSSTDSWSAPAGQIVLSQGALWGIYKDTLPDGDPVTIWSGSDSPAGTDGDVVDAGAGNDWVIASGGDDRVQGGSGDDQIDGMGGNDVLEGGDGMDVINGDGLIKTGFMNSVAAALHGAGFAIQAWRRHRSKRPGLGVCLAANDINYRGVA